MTAGITGVFWLPRLAEGNSIALNAGSHAIPMSGAATAWGALTAAWVDANATVVRVMAELGVGMQSVNGIGALARLVGFTGWAQQQGAMAATLGTKAASQATAYTVASIAMPSLPEIAAVNAARAAAHTTGGVLNGSSQVAETAKAALDLRAALTMETYEAAITALVLTPGEFLNPPPIANGAGQADPGPAEDAMKEANGDPVKMLAAAGSALAQNPGVASAVTQAANVAGSVASTGVTTVGNLGANAIAAATTTSAPASVAPMPGMVTGAVAASTAAAATRAGGVPSSALGLNNGGLKVPEGWGAPPASGAAPATESVAVTRGEAAPVRPAGPGTAGSPLMGNARAGREDEQDHDAADYLRGNHFADGRYIADGVIGAEPQRSDK
ncbi:PPE domain-containing protein [Nocardia flavorosea]|uniref:PPE domain-containing protein n=1 Tax=Nocardia flavorosea TaxID=53429 RepID=A0A846YAW5_9NOCA|nr:PPE domain-containing protein [Nocardia flavorosea]NKY56253.1 PPE domain-containing protein [Nocardia flavorosea]